MSAPDEHRADGIRADGDRADGDRADGYRTDGNRTDGRGSDVTSIDEDHGTWQRVSPKYVVVDLVGTAVFALVAIAAASVWLVVTGDPRAWVPPVVVGAVMIAYVAFTPRRVRSIGYRLRDDDLLFRRGVMFRRMVAVPYGRMQLVDITRGPLARALGLAELKFVTAAAATGVVLPGLPIDDAERLRDRLIELAETRRAGL